MRIKESELAVLEALSSHGRVTGPELVQWIGSLSKQHLYVLLNGLEQSELVKGEYEPTGRRGPPQRRYELTPRGRAVHSAAKKLAEELEAAGRMPEFSWRTAKPSAA